jgi:hypothetical protein
MKKSKLILHISAFAISCFFASCSFEGVRTDEPGQSKNIGVDSINPSQLQSPMDTMYGKTAAATKPNTDTVKAVNTEKPVPKEKTTSKKAK